MGCFSKSKFDKLTREEVVEAIITLQKEEKAIETEISEKEKDIIDCTEKAKREKDRNLKLLRVKQLNFAKEEISELSQRAMYIMYNERMLKKLKTSVEDNKFFAKTSGIAINRMLADQKGLAAFLNKALNTRVKAEDVLTSADDVWQEVKDSYLGNDTIYGTNKSDDQILALFEAENQADSEMGIDVETIKQPEQAKKREMIAEGEEQSTAAPTASTAPVAAEEPMETAEIIDEPADEPANETNTEEKHDE